MSKVAIVIPVYKNEMSPYEAISLQQCFAVLGNYPIVFICPKNMEMGSFHLDYRRKAQFLFFDNDNFESTTTYNRMMLSVWFYSHFINYLDWQHSVAFMFWLVDVTCVCSCCYYPCCDFNWNSICKIIIKYRKIYFLAVWYTFYLFSFFQK